MIVHTKESLIRGKFSLSTPIKCNCGMFHMRNKPTVDWLGQCGGRGDHRGASLIPYRIIFFACFCFACVCMALCGTCTLVPGRVFFCFFIDGALHFFAFRWTRAGRLAALSLDVLPRQVRIYTPGRLQINKHKQNTRIYTFDLNVPVPEAGEGNAGLDLNKPVLEDDNDISKFASLLFDWACTGGW